MPYRHGWSYIYVSRVDENLVSLMPPVRNKFNRIEAFRQQRKAKIQRKLQKRLAQSKSEAHDPAAKQVRSSTYVAGIRERTEILQQKRLAANIPRTLDAAREPDASAQIPSATDSAIPQTCLDPTTEDSHSSSYSPPTCDPSLRPKTLITTSPKATKATYALCDELVGVFPGAEFFPRKKQGFELGRIAGWASGRGYRHLCVVNEDMKKPSKSSRLVVQLRSCFVDALTLIHLPHGPTAYFKLTSIELTSQIFVGRIGSVSLVNDR
jgi:ribosome production factor 1